MYLFSMEGAGARAARLADLRERILHRLGDSAHKIWSSDEVDSYIRLGAREMSAAVKPIWDIIYAENIPMGFSYTADWESIYVDFNFGVASYTAEFEGAYGDAMPDFWDLDDVNRGFYTSPSEMELLVEALASTDIAATFNLPGTLTDIDRVTWDNRTIDATSYRRAMENDSRYEITKGEVIAYTLQKDGARTFRKIRVPTQMADIYTITGSWGIVRETDDVTDDTATGTWGIPRIIAGHHPMGDTGGWGTPRRFYQEGNNVRIEHWRQLTVWDNSTSELPDHYFLYLADYAQWKCNVRNGPGQDYKMAELYKQRWLRGLARIQGRISRQWKERLNRMGGESNRSASGPPRPRLPWQYGSRVR